YGNFNTNYTIGNRTVYLNTYRNSTKAVYIGDVVPDIDGEVTITVSTTLMASQGQTSAIIIEAYTDSEGGTVLSAPAPPDTISTIIQDHSPRIDNAGKANIEIS